MVFCEHCEITLIRQSHQQSDCGFDTRYLGGPGPFFSGPFCCNCAKQHHGWSAALYSAYACYQCKARAKDTGKRKSDEQALSDEEAQWEAYFLRESYEANGGAENIGKSRPPSDPKDPGEKMPQGPAMVQRHIMAPPTASLVRPSDANGLHTQGSTAKHQPEAKTPRGGMAEASMTPRRAGLASIAPEVRRRDEEERRTQEGERREQDKKRFDGRREEGRLDERKQERHNRSRESPQGREVSRDSPRGRELGSYLNREALREHTRGQEASFARERENGRDRDSGRDRDGRGLGLEPRRGTGEMRQRRESPRAAAETAVMSYSPVQHAQEQADKVLDDAHREAQRIVSEAKRQASLLVDEARRQSEERLMSVQEDDEEVGPLARRTISVFFYGELAAATRNFSEANRIGGGGFGSVFKMESLEGLGHTNRMAVKRLDPSSMQGQTEFLQEVQVLGGCRHENLLPLIGFSTDVGTTHAPRPAAASPKAEERDAGDSGKRLGVGAVCLVLPLMKGGSLEDRLTPEQPASSRRLRMLSGGWLGAGPPPLTWQERLHACVCVARALDYLHTPDEVVRKPVILHRDIKPANILLDADMHARLADVGLARMQMNNMTHVSFTQLAGTKGFLDPNYMQTGHFDASADGYALGVTILMCLTGWPACDGGETIIDRCFKRKARDVADSRAGWPREKAKEVLRVALGLVQMPRRSRSMTVADARAALEAIEDPVDATEEVLERECIICLSMPRQVRFPCGHSALCQGCYQQFLLRPRAKCPHCRQSLHQRDFRTITSNEVASQNTFVRPLGLAGGGGALGGQGPGAAHYGGGRSERRYYYDS